MHYLQRSWAVPKDLKHIEASFYTCSWFRQICCAYESLRCLYLQIWQFLWRQRQTKPIALPLESCMYHRLELELSRAHTPVLHLHQSERYQVYIQCLASVCWRPLPTYAWPVVHEQKAHGLQWARSIGMANKMHYLWRSWAVPKELKHTEASFSPISTDSCCLRVAQIPISQDMAIFMVTTTDRQTDRRQTKPITLPFAHARGVINWGHMVCPLYGGSPFFEESIVGGSTVVLRVGLELTTFSLRGRKFLLTRPLWQERLGPYNFMVHYLEAEDKN